jgi:flagellar motor switch protein FliN/FliY
LNSVNNVYVEISVVLGKSTLPIHQLLKMGRGAVIELENEAGEEVTLLANNAPIARGQIIVSGEKISVSITTILTPGKE